MVAGDKSEPKRVEMSDMLYRLLQKPLSLVVMQPTVAASRRVTVLTAAKLYSRTLR